MASAFGVTLSRGGSGGSSSVVESGSSSGSGLTVDKEFQRFYEDMVEMLVAAGYFRARIPSLQPFDKIVGGMAWAISGSNVDVDVDINFREDAHIGHKIKLGESIEKALRLMRCPHPVQAHQVQGLDMKNLFPAVQWLVKKMLETRAETEASVRRTADLNFGKRYQLPAEAERDQKQRTGTGFVEDVSRKYGPRRLHRRTSRLAVPTEEVRVHSTLLEYGKYSRGAASGEGGAGAEGDERAAAAAEEEEALRRNLDEASEANRVSADNVGRIVNMGSDSIRKAASEYDERSRELEANMSAEKSAAMGHKRQLEALRRRLENRQEALDELNQRLDEARRLAEEAIQRHAELRRHHQELEDDIDRMNEVEDSERAEEYRALKAVLELNDKMERDCTLFRETCHAQLAEWQRKIAELEKGGGVSVSSVSSSGLTLPEVEEAIQRDKEKRLKLEAMAAEKNQEVDGLGRLIDEIPTRAELLQYERRFTELYDQVTAKLEETRRYFNTSNSLREQCSYMQKELSLMNSIQEDIAAAMASQGPARDKFIENLESYVKSIQDSTQSQVESKLQQSITQRNALVERLDQLREHQRAYFRAVKSLQGVMRENETLQR